MATWMGGLYVEDVFGIDQRGEYFGAAFLDAMAGGSGARSFADGLDAGGFLDSPSSIIANVEDYEYSYPVLYLYRRIQSDTGGAGRFRGGATRQHVLRRRTTSTDPDEDHARDRDAAARLGRDRRRLPVVHQPVRDQARHEHPRALRRRRAPERARARSTASSRSTRTASCTRRRPATTSTACVAMGGGGYGDPLDRDPERVRRDVVAGVVTREHARERYGVRARCRRRTRSTRRRPQLPRGDPRRAPRAARHRRGAMSAMPGHRHRRRQRRHVHRLRRARRARARARSARRRRRRATSRSGVIESVARAAEALGVDARASCSRSSYLFAPRDDGRDQRAPDAVGVARRPDHDEGTRGRADRRPHDPEGRRPQHRRADEPGSAREGRSDRPAPPDPRRDASGSTTRGRSIVPLEPRRGARRRWPSSSRRASRRSRSASSGASSTPRTRRAVAELIRDAHPELDRLGLARGRARDQGVRARRDDDAERVPERRHRPLDLGARGAACRQAACGRAPLDHAVLGRRHLDREGEGARDQARRVGPGGRRDRRRGTSGRRSASPT